MQDTSDIIDYLEALDTDVWLGAHPFVNRTLEKHERAEGGETPSPFIDRKGWLQFLKSKRVGFERLVAEKSAELEIIEDMGHDLPPALWPRLAARIARHAHAWEGRRARVTARARAH